VIQIIVNSLIILQFLINAHLYLHFQDILHFFQLINSFFIITHKFFHFEFLEFNLHNLIVKKDNFASIKLIISIYQVFDTIFLHKHEKLST